LPIVCITNKKIESYNIIINIHQPSNRYENILPVIQYLKSGITGFANSKTGKKYFVYPEDFSND